MVQVAVTCVFAALLAGIMACSPPQRDIIEVSASFPWSVCDDSLAIRELQRDLRGHQRMAVKLNLNRDHPKAMVCLSLTEIPGLQARAPVGLADEWKMTIDVPSEFMGAASAPNGWGLWYKDALWRWKEAPGGWQNLDRAGRHSLTVPMGDAQDLTEVGFYIGLGHLSDEYRGQISVSVDRLRLRPSAPRAVLLPGERKALYRLDRWEDWHPGTSFRGVTGVALSAAPGVAALRCHFDSQDRFRRSGVAMVDLRRLPGVQPTPLDMRDLGLFVSVKAPVGFLGTGKFASGVHAGLVDDEGQIFWGPWERITDTTWVTAALLPEVALPLPLSFCPVGFDPGKIVGVAVRLTVDQAVPLRFTGDVLLRDVRISSPAESVLTARRDVKQALADDEGPVTRTSAGMGAARVPISTFIDNSGVNYPWPEEVYPGIGPRSWNPSVGGFRSMTPHMRRDFSYLDSSLVRLVRVFIAGDCRTGFVFENGAMWLDPSSMADVDSLLAVVEAFPRIRLVPVLFDFSIADGEDRERMGLVGERPDLLEIAGPRRQLLDAIEPILLRLATHPQVLFLDILAPPQNLWVAGKGSGVS